MGVVLLLISLVPSMVLEVTAVLSADVRFTVAQKHFAVNLQLKEGLYLVMGRMVLVRPPFYVY